MNEYNGKTAVVTGGASGIGLQLVKALHQKGAVVLVADLNETAAAVLACNLNAERANSAFYKRVDVTKWDDQVELFNFAIDRLKRLDYVFPNAGIAESNFLSRTSTSEMQYIKPDMATINIDLIGVLYTSNLAVQAFRTQPLVDGFRGKIVATGSIVSWAATPYLPLYSASKAAVLAFVRSFAPVLEPDNITINVVCPNVTRSNLVAGGVFDAVDKQGVLTPNEVVIQAFLQFLGDSTLTGQSAEASLDNITIRQQIEYLDHAVEANVQGIADYFKATYYPPL